MERVHSYDSLMWLAYTSYYHFAFLGFSNALWSQPGTALVEFPLTAERPFFSHLAAALNFSYWVVPEICADPWGYVIH